MTRRLLLCSMLVPFFLVACGGGSSTTSPGANVPFGLAEVTWPKDASSLEGVFAGLPDTLEGLPRADAPYLTATYGAGKTPGVSVYAVDLGAAECPGMSGGSLVRSTLEQNGRVKVAEESPDDVPEGVPAYLLGTRGGRYVAGWSVPRVHWVFAVEAATPALREAAIRAVVEAARSLPPSSASAEPAAA
ncbi:MAG: hypothetical protein ACM3OO_05330 [Planctomycetaceae bacterium]